MRALRVRWSVGRDEFGEQVADAVVDVVADGADPLDGLSGGVVEFPVEVPFAGVNGAGDAAAHGDDDVGGPDDLVGKRFGVGVG